jgi:LysM repeat protein
MVKKKTFTTFTAGLLFFTALSSQAEAHEQTYTVKSGDVPWKIAASNNIEIQELFEWNNLSSTSSIYPNQKLSIIAPHEYLTYTVKSGDYLWKIAQQYNTTIAAIQETNNLTSYQLRVGQVLTIPTKETELIAPASNTYTVKSGDLLWKIASAHQLTVEQLKQLNNLSSNTIYPGQVLIVKAEDSNNTTIHTVKSGEYLWLIANKYNVTVDAIKSVNNLTRDSLKIGQVLKIPAATGVKEAPLQTDNEQQTETPQYEAPSTLQNGMFPLKAGSYQPFTNTYANSRTWSPDGTVSRSHEGVDIMADKGTPIYAATDGKIVNVGWNEFGGWRLTIKASGTTTAIFYAHMEKYAGKFANGDTITKGQLIGYVGDSGYGPEGTTGKFVSHLHIGFYNTANDWTAFDPYSTLKYWESK